MTTPTTSCPSCGSAATGNFCSACGAVLAGRNCSACQAPLSPKARFCHRCGHPVPGGAAGRGPERDRLAWMVAGLLCVLLLATIVWKVTRGVTTPAAPDMANAGAAGGARAPSAAPDISTMTPRERFDRLFNRIMQAAEQGDTAQIQRFLPMALGAFGQLDSVDVDAEYHAAVLHLQGGDAGGAETLADSILAQSPGHLFGYLIKAEAAGLRNDPAARARAEREFMAHYDAEMKAGRVEYAEHKPAIEAFRKEAAR